MISIVPVDCSVLAPTVCGFPERMATEGWLPHELRAAGYDRQQYTLLRPFRYLSPAYGLIEVPAGFSTDLASIPRAAFAYIAPDDPAIEYASVVHDYLYSRRGLLPDGRVFTRQQADEVLVEGMELCGARWDQRKIVYAAVRLGGASHWKP